jgi:hypothetical protein
MKSIKIFLSLFIIFHFLTSCHKTIEINQVVPNELVVAENIRNGINASSARIVSDDSLYSNYFYIRFSQLANRINRDSSYDIDAYANFNHTDIGIVTINNNIDILPDADNIYHYHFPINAGLSLMGTSLPVNAAEPIDTVTNNTLTISRVRNTTVMVIPTQIYPLSVSFPASVIDRMAVLPLTWAAYPNNQFGKVQISVKYYPGISQHNATGMPNAITQLNYQVADNGSFTIPAADLNRFPRDSYVGISIARAWSVTSANNVVYVAFVEGRTIPLLVVSSGPLVVDIGTTPYNVQAVLCSAVVNGGVPPFTYQWRIHMNTTGTWGNVLSTSPSIIYDWGCRTAPTTNEIFKLTVTDALGNIQSREKYITHKCLR